MSEEFKTVVVFTLVLLVVGILGFYIDERFKETHYPVYIYGRASNVEIDYSGINILNASWEVRWQDGSVTRQFCDRCSYNEVPVNGQEIVNKIWARKEI